MRAARVISPLSDHMTYHDHTNGTSQSDISDDHGEQNELIFHTYESSNRNFGTN